MNLLIPTVKIVAGSILLAGTALLASSASRREAGSTDAVARGKYLVNAIGCADCHTPLVAGPNGPEPDLARNLSGHPESLVMPANPALEAPWAFAAASTLTAWSGPWGTSFTANLTPDEETGLGSWSAEQFVETIRTQRHL